MVVHCKILTMMMDSCQSLLRDYNYDMNLQCRYNNFLANIKASHYSKCNVRFYYDLEFILNWHICDM